MSKREKSYSPPLFSDDEDVAFPTKRVKIDSETDAVDGDNDNNDPMFGFMDGYEDLGPDEIEAKDADYAFILSFVLGETASIDELPPHLRFEAQTRWQRWQLRQDGAPGVAGVAGAVAGPAGPLASGHAQPEQPEQREDEQRELEPEQHREQLALLAEMGFGAAADRPRVVRALTETHGDFEAALERLLADADAGAGGGGGGPSENAAVPLTREKTIQEIVDEIEETERNERRRMEEADSLLAQKIQQQVEREEHDKTLRQIKQSTHSQDSSSSSSSSSTSNHFQPILPRPTVMQNTVSYSGSSSSQAYNNNHTHAYIKPESKPFAGIDLTEEEDPYQAFINRPTPSSSSSSQFPQKFIPPPPVVRYSSQSSFTDKAKPYNPYIPPSPPTKQEAPIYDMSGLLLNKTPSYANHSFHGDFPGDDSAHNDPYEAPLKEGEVTEQLKDLLENVAITAAEIPIEQRLPSPPELKVQLLEHQKIGVEWMLKMEHGTNKGGILADDMGLGKTVQSITTCILNRQSDGNKKTTLIVAPTSLILQWRDELREKVKTGTFKVLVYYGKERKNKTVNSLKQFDIVITTYGTVAMEWPQVKKKRVKKDPFDRPIDEDEDVAFERDREEEALNEFQVLAQRGELFKMHWHRVILDEAHTIKNKGTRVARACVQLKANLRWCLTGTPIQNKIGELYSLIDFLKIRPYCHWDKFRDEIEKPFRAGKHKRVLKRVQALLKAICLRRTKNSTLDGRPIIVLEPKTVELVEAHFTPAEREFYQSLEKKTLLKFNAYLKAGTVMQNYSNILVLLLRLRQACCHPTLVSQNFSEAPPELLAAAEASAVAVKPQDPLTVLSDEIQQRLLKMNLKTGYECPICFDAITDGKIIPDCGHVYCSDCLLDHVAAVGVNGGNEEKVCPQCRGEIHVNQLISVDLFLKSAKKANLLEANEKLGNEQVAMSKKASGKLPIHLSQQQPAVDDDGYEIDEMDGGWISSTKIDQMMKVLLAIRRDTPNDKTIVFTQFRGMMDLCQTPLFEKNIGYVRYDGSMSADQRDAAVTTFREDPGTTVILVSLKCGSLGLNLTCANHVVIVDFWWNVAVENQAVDRVHRFGQKKAVTVHRISIKDTVEQRILALQNEKQELFNAALGEGGVKGLSKNRLGLNDLIKLFRGDGAGADLSDDDD